MSHINLIFATKFYPHCNCGNIVWTDSNLPIEEDLSFNRKMVPPDYKFEYIKERIIPNDENTLFYNVYVVPCTVDTKLSKKLSYINNVVKIIIPNADADTLKNTFLIAHDKDFDKNGDCMVLSRIDGIVEYPYLGKLLDLRHIFLFQHDGKLKQRLNRIPCTDENALDIKTCEYLHNMADAKSRMIRFFNFINQKDKDNNNYPIRQKK